MKKNKYGETPLCKACENGNKGLVEYLVENEAYINKQKNWSGEIPLFKATESRNKDLREFFEVE